jgi:hypothetical protein
MTIDNALFQVAVVGTFGTPDSELGYRPERSATLEQVLGEGGKMVYTYDFGDSWDHVIALESIAPPLEGVAYPRCIGGHRAAPPEDSGGIWGYEALCAAANTPIAPRTVLARQAQHQPPNRGHGPQTPRALGPARSGVAPVEQIAVPAREETR